MEVKFLDKFFEFIFSIPLIRKFKPFYEKRKDIVLYTFFGGLTTIVSFFTFWVCIDLVKMHELIANTFSWIFAVAFAFFTNRIWVFNSPTKTAKDFIKQFILFYAGRLFSFAVEMGIIYLFITLMGFNELLIKLAATIIVLILNYIISKVFVFRNKSEKNTI